MNETKSYRKIVVRLIIFAIALVAILGVFYLVAHLLGWTQMTKEEIQDLLASTGATAPLIFIAMSFLQVTLIPIPSNITILVGSYLFGVWKSFLYSYIGIMAGSLFAFFLGKTLGKPFVHWVFGSKEESEKYMQRLKDKETVVLFFMFLLPIFPDDALCALAGILPIGWTKFICMQLITRVTTICGTLFFMSGEIIPYNGWGLAVLLTVAIISLLAFIICYKHADTINKTFDTWINKLTQKLRKETKNSSAEEEINP